MIKRNAFLLLSIILLAACRGDKGRGRFGKAALGGMVRLNEIENFKSLFPVSINEVTNYHIATQVYEGLVRYEAKDLSIIPAIARAWDVSPDLKQYTFHIRPNVFYHRDDCFKD